MQLAAYLAILLLLAWPLARAIDAAMQGRFALSLRTEVPLYRLAGVDPAREQGCPMPRYRLTEVGIGYRFRA